MCSMACALSGNFSRAKSAHGTIMYSAWPPCQPPRLNPYAAHGKSGLAFSQLNAAEFWQTASLDQKQRLQQVLFPEGVEYSGRTFGTSTTCLLFSGIEAK